MPTASEASTGGMLVADEPVRLHGVENEVREDYLQIYDSETRQVDHGHRIHQSEQQGGPQGQAALYSQAEKALGRRGQSSSRSTCSAAAGRSFGLPKAVLKTIQPGKYVINVYAGGSLDYEFYPVDAPLAAAESGHPLEIRRARRRA